MVRYYKGHYAGCNKLGTACACPVDFFSDRSELYGVKSPSDREIELIHRRVGDAAWKTDYKVVLRGSRISFDYCRVSPTPHLRFVRMESDGEAQKIPLTVEILKELLVWAEKDDTRTTKE